MAEDSSDQSALDVRGDTVVAGDRVAVAFRDSNLPELRIGVVLRFDVHGEGSWQGPEEIMWVEWEHTSRGWGMPEKSFIRTKYKRFVRLG